MKCLNYLLPVMLLLPAFAVQSCDDDDDNFRKMREYKDLIAEIRKAFKEHPDAVIVQFCEN